jgi:hypothetical protein
MWWNNVRLLLWIGNDFMFLFSIVIHEFEETNSFDIDDRICYWLSSVEWNMFSNHVYVYCRSYSIRINELECSSSQCQQRLFRLTCRWDHCSMLITAPRTCSLWIVSWLDKSRSFGTSNVGLITIIVVRHFVECDCLNQSRS